ncbi:MAG TPA: AAA family ATPase, partial [Bacteroidetes bacterium]|nr:AAA family ATPase [Bacteroidota bacterium]
MIRHLTLENLRKATVAMLEPDAQQRVLFMTGEAGIGKTTLLRELQLQLETEDSNNILVARTECSTPVAGQDVGEV